MSTSTADQLRLNELPPARPQQLRKQRLYLFLRIGTRRDRDFQAVSTRTIDQVKSGERPAPLLIHGDPGCHLAAPDIEAPIFLQMHLLTSALARVGCVDPTSISQCKHTSFLRASVGSDG